MGITQKKEPFQAPFHKVDSHGFVHLEDIRHDITMAKIKCVANQVHDWKHYFKSVLLVEKSHKTFSLFQGCKEDSLVRFSVHQKLQLCKYIVVKDVSF